MKNHLINFCLIFSLFGVVVLGTYVYVLRKEMKYLQTAHSNVVQENQQLSLNMEENLKKLNAISEQVSLLDASISPTDKRWAKIKKVRKAVQDTITNEGLTHNIPDINGLTTIASAVVDYSEQYDVSIPLILAIMRNESAFNPHAVSHSNAQGLMQMLPSTAKECSGNLNKPYYNIFNIKDSIQFGTWYLWRMMDEFNGDVEMAIRSYNFGPHNVKKVISGEFSEYPRETINYHKVVMASKQYYEQM